MKALEIFERVKELSQLDFSPELNDEFNQRLVEVNDEIQASTRREALKAYLQ